MGIICLKSSGLKNLRSSMYCRKMSGFNVSRLSSNSVLFAISKTFLLKIFDTNAGGISNTYLRPLMWNASSFRLHVSVKCSESKA